MALRLTGTSQAAQRPLTPTELASQAAAVLAGGDCARYRELFERAGALEDGLERYHGRVLLVERGLTAAAAVAPAQASQIFLAAAEALLEALEQEPREPVLLNYAGVVLYELWSLDAARAMFKAALRLDAGLPHCKRNLDEVARRLRSGGPARLRPLHAALPALARRAKRVAEQARPATGLTLSLCMIVRDEEDMLPRCLAAAAPAVDEIVIVDTGSSDRTVEIARSFGARVIEFPWTGSFAEARNVSFEAATGDWVMYLDADEVLVADDVQRLRALTGRVWREAFYLLETSYTGEDGDGTSMVHPALRVFRNRPRYRFEGRMHEQIQQLPTHLPGRIEHSSVRVQHFGYLVSVRDAKEKSRRNIELLRAQQSEGADGPFLHFNLGTEYAAVGDAMAALGELEHAWELVKSQGEQDRDYVPTLLLRLTSALRACSRGEDSLALADEALALMPGFTDLVFARGQTLAELGRPEEAAAAWQRCLEMGDAPARYGAVVGAGSYLPMLALAELHRRGGRLEEARALLERCVREHPAFVGAIAPYAAALLATGAPPEDVVAEIEERVPEPPASVRFMLAQALRAHRALPEAERQYRAVLARRPGSSQLRIALAETLLSQGSYAEAAELAREIAPEDAFAAQAARIELWATVAGQELERIAGAHARAQGAGISPAELDVFRGWAALLQGEAPAGALGIAGTPLLGVILETLLAMHDFTAFERLLPLLEGSELPARERRELLAGLYLRHGFLQSAAREWMAVCEQQPDARALVGLSRVAAAHGLAEDAATFAAQALVLEPRSEAAHQLLAR
ncbi:MAG TPA: glycosyltransferase [Solirubrobacteraceae bacterium]|nr:glycosyltransferase [Solirubrobacteraceae bacterium]